MKDSKKTKDQLLIENKSLKTELERLKDLDRLHRLALKDLQNSTEKLKIIFDNAPDAILLMDFNGTFLDVNRIFEEVLGISKEVVISKNVFELNLLPDSEIKKIKIGVEKNINGEKFGPKEILVKDINDNIVYSEILSYPVKIDNKTVILAIARDITKRKRAEETLRNNQQRLSLHFNQTPLGVIEWNINKKVKKWNPAAERIFGYSEKEAIGKHANFIVPLYHDKDVEIIWDNLFNVRGGERNTNKNIKKNGEEILCEWYNTPLVNEQGEVIAVASLVQDISERVRTEKIQKLLYNISNAVNTTDNLEKLIGFIQNELGRIIDTTNFYIALYNENDDTLSLPFFVDEKDKFTTIPAGKTLTKYVVKTQKPLLADIQLMNELEKHGEIITVGSDSKIWLGVPLKTEGKVTGVLAVQSYTNENAYNKDDVQMLEFVSDQICLSINRKKTEEELVEALKKAKESEKLKTAFLQNISHEIRTPMNGILGFTMLLKESGLDSDEQKEYLEIIEKSGERMLNTINDLMDISKVEAGQMDIIETKININELIDYTHTFFLPEAEQKGLNLNCEKDLPESEIIIFSDKEKLYAILTNLVKNAIKYTEKGSISFGYTINNQNIKFYVKDSGIGIAKENLNSIFNRFIQVHQNLTSKYEGTGLGLSITKAYVELLGGKISVKSEYGKGSAFYFEIPAKTDGNIELNSKINENNKLLNHNEKKQLKIIIAEDNETILNYLSIIVRKISKQVLITKDGEETVEVCRNNPDVDLILMDIKMPKMDGYEATKNIRKFNNNVVIIAQTAFAFESEQEKAVTAGFNDYIAKPVNQNNITEIIGKYF